jgi:hypothetical protein
MGGVAAMKEHIVETVAGELVVSATALLLAYGSKFAWDLVKSDYNDHHELVASCFPSQNALSDMAPVTEQATDMVCAATDDNQISRGEIIVDAGQQLFTSGFLVGRGEPIR